MQLSFDADWAIRPGPVHRKRVRNRDRDLLAKKLIRAAIKAAGGAAYEKLLENERAARARYRARHPLYWREHREKYGKWGNKKRSFKVKLCALARSRARKRGLEGTIRPEDLVWPTHCPVLGIELDYPARGERRGNIPQDNWPSLDRWDSTEGYVPGNVFVISFRANTLKNNGCSAEFARILAYTAQKPSHG